MSGHSKYDYARDDAKFLKTFAASLSYNDDPEASRKHRLNEIAMRLETKFYHPRETCVSATIESFDDDLAKLTQPRKKPVAQPAPRAPLLLEAAAKHMRDRAATYDKPEGERSMSKTVEAFNAITGRDLNESEGWLLMAVLKMVRSEQRRDPHRDSVEDLVAYSALYGEVRLAGE